MRQSNFEFACKHDRGKMKIKIKPIKSKLRVRIRRKNVALSAASISIKIFLKDILLIATTYLVCIAKSTTLLIRLLLI